MRAIGPQWPPIAGEPAATADDEEQRDYVYGRSPLTGQWYRVHGWEDHGDGKIVAKSKKEVKPEQVPDRREEATEAAMP